MPRTYLKMTFEKTFAIIDVIIQLGKYGEVCQLHILPCSPVVSCLKSHSYILEYLIPAYSGWVHKCLFNCIQFNVYLTAFGNIFLTRTHDLAVASVLLYHLIFNNTDEQKMQKIKTQLSVIFIKSFLSENCCGQHMVKLSLSYACKTKWYARDCYIWCVFSHAWTFTSFRALMSACWHRNDPLLTSRSLFSVLCVSGAVNLSVGY